MERTPSGRRVTMREAARLLDISEEAVRKRVRRGTVPSELGEDGRRYVWLDVPDEGEDAKDEVLSMVDVLREEIAHMRRESERKDAIIMQLSQAASEQARTIREIEAPSRMAQEAPEAPVEAEEGRGAGPTGGEAERASERPWWRRLFGGS